MFNACGYFRTDTAYGDLLLSIEGILCCYTGQAGFAADFYIGKENPRMEFFTKAGTQLWCICCTIRNTEVLIPGRRRGQCHAFIFNSSWRS